MSIRFRLCSTPKYSAPGSVTQIRDTAATLMRIAKEQAIATFLVGHVTKEGSIAGPKILEHIVDTVLYFRGRPIQVLSDNPRHKEPFRLNKRNRRLRDVKRRSDRNFRPLYPLCFRVARTANPVHVSYARWRVHAPSSPRYRRLRHRAASATQGGHQRVST